MDEPTQLQRKIVEYAADIMEAQCETPEFLHSVLCQVGLPRSKTNERRFLRQSGNAAIEVIAGSIFRRGQMVQVPLPYGARPRLVLLHICAEAVRTRSPEIEVGQSAREFLTRLGVTSNGNGYSRFRAQIEALAACHLTVGLKTNKKEITVSGKPISKFEAWVQHDHKSIGLWPGSVTLSHEFLISLLEHAVPLDPRAIAALKGSALALDVYAWLAQRLCRIRNVSGIKITWKSLLQQFGQEYKTAKDFKKVFKIALRKVCAVYPDACIEEGIGGLTLLPSPPPIRKTQMVLPFSRGAIVTQ